MKDDAFFLRHMLDAVNQIEDYTNVTYDEFLETRLIQIKSSGSLKSSARHRTDFKSLTINVCKCIILCNW